MAWFGKNDFRTKNLLLLSALVLAGCQTQEDEVSKRSENIDVSIIQPTAVKISAPLSGENPVNAVKRTGMKPELLRIPAIGVEAEVQHLGVAEDGAMAVPDAIEDVSWYEQGYWPGQNGRAVIAGHVDGLEGPAVFWDLSQLEPGDEIVVEGKKEKMKFQVQAMESVPLEGADISSIFGYSSSPELVLITCSGLYNKSLGTREERLIVYASYIEE